MRVAITMKPMTLHQEMRSEVLDLCIIIDLMVGSVTLRCSLNVEAMHKLFLTLE